MAERLTGPIEIGDRLIWEPDKPHARRAVEVTELRLNADDERWVKLRVLDDDPATPHFEGPGGEYWNEESRVREACIRERS